MNHQKQMTEYLLAFIKGLKQAGIKQAVISPGSRSTPLALLLHRDADIDCFIDVDERSAAFFALGLIKATQNPVALVCTSGSAAANFYPAICEAKATQLPLVVLTTDRPAELRAVGAPQAMDQQYLYSSHVKAFVEMLLPENTEDILRYSHWQGLTNVLKANQLPKGPVHLNLPLREPLLPDLELNIPEFPTANLLPVNKTIDLTSLSNLFSKPGLIVVGEQRTPEEAQQLLAFAESLNWPIVGDPLTNLANCGRQSANYLKQADLIFSRNVPLPEVVLRFGRLPVTKNVMLYLKKITATTILVEEGGQWLEQLQSSNYFLDLTLKDFSQSFAKIAFKPISSDWLHQWQLRQQLATEIIEQEPSFKEFNETSATITLLNHLENQNLFVANSNAIRFVDRLAANSNQNFMIYGNRGLNGIDGLNSTIAGIAAGENKPLVLLIGDLAFFHDMNGLQMMKQYQLPVTIVLLNNNGGGIFNFLSQNQLSESDFEPLFGTPLNLDFKHVAQLYGVAYHQPQSFSELTELLAKPSFQLIEINGNQKEPVQIWQKLNTDYQKALGESLD